MDPVSKMLRGFSRRFTEMSPGARMLLGSLVGLALVAGVLVSVFGSGATYQYAFTNLSPEDASDAAAALKACRAGAAWDSSCSIAATSAPPSSPSG